MNLYILCWEVNGVQTIKSDYCFIEAIDHIDAQAKANNLQISMPESSNFRLFSVGVQVV